MSEWYKLYSDLCLIIDKLEKHYYENPSESLRQELDAYIKERNDYIKYINNEVNLEFNDEFYNSLSIEDKKYYLLSVLTVLEKVPGRKELVSVNGKKVYIAKVCKNKYIRYSTMLNNLLNPVVKEEKSSEVISVASSTCEEKNNKIKMSRFTFRAAVILSALVTYATTTVSSAFYRNGVEAKQNTEYVVELEAETVSKTVDNTASELSKTVGSAAISSCEVSMIRLASVDESLFITLPEENKNEYFDVAPLCTEDIQDCIYETAIKYDIPYDIMFAIIDKESGGNWNTNGVISATNDYGLAQINICNHKMIEEKLGYTSDDLLNDPYKNIDAMGYLLTCIFNAYGYNSTNYDAMNIFGVYNGWLNWKNIDRSINYANTCLDILEEKYSSENRVKTLSLTND